MTDRYNPSQAQVIADENAQLYHTSTEPLVFDSRNDLSVEQTIAKSEVIFDPEAEKNDKARAFFREVADGKTFEDVSILVTTTILPYQTRPFVDALAEGFNIVGVHKKPGSNSEQVNRMREDYSIIGWSRDEAKDPEAVARTFELNNFPRALILDIGGYHVPSLHGIAERLGSRFIGVVEDTQNGIQDYRNLDRTRGLPCPVIHVAESPLKRSEDYQVGSNAAIYSAEDLLRKKGDILTGKTVLSIGYGPIGSSVAEGAKRRQLKTIVADNNPILRLQAMSKDFETTDLEEGLPFADLVFSATGNHALNRDNFHLIKHGADVALLTSGDKETDEEGLRKAYDLHSVNDNTVACVAKDGSNHYFYLLNGLRTINFTPHDSVLEKWIRPVQAELLVCAQRLAENKLPNKIMELPNEERMRIASIFAKHYEKKLT